MATRDEERKVFVDAIKPEVLARGKYKDVISPTRTVITAPGAVYGTNDTVQRQITRHEATIKPGDVQFEILKDENTRSGRGGYARIHMNATNGDGTREQAIADIQRTRDRTQKFGIPVLDNAKYVMTLTQKGSDGVERTSVYPVSATVNPGARNSTNYSLDTTNAVHFIGNPQTGTRVPAPDPNISVYTDMIKSKDGINRALKDDKFVQAPKAPGAPKHA
jgi:hypothetical protein